MNIYGHFADSVLVLHAAFVAFVVIGQLLIVTGLLLDWRWVRSLRLRVAHALAIGIVMLQAWLGVLCPLTILENYLRRQSGEAGYVGSFVEHWLHRLIFYEAESWVFTLLYTGFALLVAATWWWGRPVR